MKRIILLIAIAAIPCMALAQTAKSPVAADSPGLYTPGQIREKFGVDVADGNYAPVVRAILEWMNTAAGDDAYSADVVAESLKGMALRLPEPARGMINYVVADFYGGYWQNNRWQMRDRTSAPDAGGTLDTWDLQRLFAEAIKYYELALADAATLKATPIADYDEILAYYNSDTDWYKAREYTTRYFPTLYDFLLSATIKAFANELSNALPGQQFTIDDPRWFAPAAEFVKIEIAAPETPSAEYEVLAMYQKLLGFRLGEFAAERSERNVLPLVAADVERLKYVRQRGVYDNTDELYEAALLRIADDYAAYPESAYALYGLARLYMEQGAGWNRDENQQFKGKYAEAYALCDKIIEQWPEFRKYAESLKREITATTLGVTFEKQVYPGDPFLALADYRNMDELNIRIYAMADESEARRNESIRGWTWLGNREPVLEMLAVKVPEYGDYQPVKAQLMIPALPQGHYLLVASEDSSSPGVDYRDNAPFANTTFQVSPLACVIRNGSGETFRLPDNTSDYVKQIYVTDAKTGRPAAGATVEVYEYDYDSPRDAQGNYPEKPADSYRTDAGGMAYITGRTRGDRNTPEALSRIVITDRKGGMLVENNYSSLYFTNAGTSRDKDGEPTAVFFTDRAIYRPGQTVYYKVLLIGPDGKGGNKPVAGHDLAIRLLDVNYKDVATDELVTNDFGSVHGSFTIPQGLLNGIMTLETDYGRRYISVEEYKRPSFEVKFDPVGKSYRYGDEVELSATAEALAGYSVDNSTVKYRVTRKFSYNYFYRPGNSKRVIMPQTAPQREIASGEVTTGADGKFTIRFTASPTGIRDRDTAYDFVVTADVTDANGETRSATETVTISDKPLVIQAVLPDEVSDRKELSFDLATTNLNGKPVAASVDVTVEALDGPGRILRQRLWDKPDTTLIARPDFERLFPHDIYADEDDPSTYAVREQVTAFTLATTATDSTKLDLGSLARRPAGWYRVTLTATDESGVTAQESYALRLKVTPSGKQTPIVNVENWAVALKDKGEPGEQAVFLIAAPDKGTTVRCDVFRKGRIVESRTVTAGPVPQRVVFPIREEDRGVFTVQFIMVSGVRSYVSTQHVSVPYTDKKLDIAFTTFRSQLLPGEHERWTLTVKNNAGGHEMAEMVATLYDASLDAFRPLTWPSRQSLLPWQNNYVPSIDTYIAKLIARTNYKEYWPYRATEFRLPYIQLYRFGGAYRGLLRNDGRGNILSEIQLRGAGTIADPSFVIKEAPVPAPAGGIDEVMVTKYLRRQQETFAGSVITLSANDTQMKLQEEDGEFILDQRLVEGSEDGKGASGGLQQIATRRNFNETAFFYPQLRTNEQGEIVIEFTVPESLTRWNMLGFAHTKDLKAGTIRNTLITQKQVAVSANAPRFLREGDTIEFTAKVNNITAGELTGEALLRLFDAATMQPLDDVITSAATLPFSVAAGQSADVRWTLRIPDGISAITYRLTAQAGNHTDGEERTIPVMSNTILITESMPFMVRAGQTETVDFARLRAGAATVQRNQSLTLEFTSNPAWYAVQAMSYLMEYPYDCAEQIFSKFYANSLSAAIVKSSPRIQAIFEQWRDVPDSKNALLSNLEKNQELKQVLIEETPWVFQAENEAERKKRVGLLFDLNQMAAGQRIAFDKLRKMQRGDGGFAWFDGMAPNRYITQHIIAGFCKLAALEAVPEDYAPEVQAILDKGFEYLDSDLLRDYEEVKKIRHFTPAGKYISYIHLHYLYAASFLGHKPADAAQREAFDFWYAQARKFWKDFSIYGKGLAALVFHRYGDTGLAKQVAASLKASSRTTSDMGMFWRENRAGYFWYEAPIETQALMISVFDEVAGDAKAVEELKIWLLRNKQTNDWQTTKATADACYALLRTGSNLLDESRMLEVKVGGRPLTEAAGGEIRPEAGTGYVKTVWAGGDVTPAMGLLEVTNPNHAGVAWGGLYWQYFELSDKVTGTETELRMEKQVFIKRNTPRGPELIAIGDGAAVKVGDLLTVRVILRAHRDYEYVHLKDMRAAGLEPVRTVSGYRYQDGLAYYESVKDASTNFFITSLRSGTYVFEYDLRVSHAGDFSNGITTFQCMYAPEFSAHSEGMRIRAE